VFSQILDFWHFVKFQIAQRYFDYIGMHFINNLYFKLLCLHVKPLLTT
jgi:hypothetical protein